jgi:hypothetical protein
VWGIDSLARQQLQAIARIDLIRKTTSINLGLTPSFDGKKYSNEDGFFKKNLYNSIVQKQ